MALTLHSDATEALTLEEFMSIVSATLDPRDPDSIAQCGTHLHALSLNKSLFDGIIQDAISTSDVSRGFQESFNGYREMTFLLGKCPKRKFFVRANVWKPPVAVAGDLNLQNDIYSYNLAHDHNFDFITVGYYGPGYNTRIHEYDYRRVEGRIGEHVELNYLEDTTLPVGKVMMYRRSVDIHTQLSPPDTSISINLMVQPPLDEYREQYGFDTSSSTIADYVEGPVNYQVSLLSLAATLGGDDFIEPLIAIAQNGVSGRTRAAAIDAVLKISPDLYSRILSQCGNDKNPNVLYSLREPQPLDLQTGKLDSTQ